MVDAKFLWSRSLKLSGVVLYSLLGISLILAALCLDLKENRLLNLDSLSLPLITCGLLTSLLGSGIIPLLQRLKAGQVIREDGPQAHLKKAGTPTMGGIFFIPLGVIVALIWSRFNLDVIGVSLLTLAYAFIGWLDDWQILRYQSNKGISPRTKLGLQIIFALLFCVALIFRHPVISTTVNLSFGWFLPLGLLFWPLAGFTLVAESNATNLTDGVDGLMGGLGAITFLGLGQIVGSSSPELMIFCACMSGACLGFVSHNRHPAKVFMGDTGSLALGAALGAIALLTNNLWALLIMSGIFLVETLSVIAQVLYYKATKDGEGKGKRLLKMAPLHHHLELSGWEETQVVGGFYLVNFVLVILALLAMKSLEGIF